MREVPANPHGYLLQDTGRRGRFAPVIPETEIQAVMEAQPHHRPARSQEEHSRSVESFAAHVEKAMKALSPLQRHVIEASVFEQRSIRDIADTTGLSKSTVHRVRTTAIAELRVQLADVPEIVEYLTRTTTENDQ